MMDQSDAGSAGIFSCWTNQARTGARACNRKETIPPSRAFPEIGRFAGPAGPPIGRTPACFAP
eukprot:3290316-Pyramimonas_sp.AAC.1